MEENKQNNTSTPNTVIIQQNASNPFGQMGNSSSDFSIKDILFLCLGHWPWFLLSLLICGCVAWYEIRTTPQVYSRTAKLLIKSDSKQSIGGVADGLSAVGINKNNANVSNELIALKAPVLYEELVRQLGLNTTYSRTGRLLDKELYGTASPIKVEFIDLGERDRARMTVQLDGKGGINIEHQSYGGQSSDEIVPATFDDTLKCLMGRVIFKKTSSYWVNNVFEIHVNRMSVYDMAGICSSRTSVYAPDKEASIINISYNDVSYQRAEDVLNKLIVLYNQNWVKDRNQVSIATSKFIGERLAVIEEELSDVEDNISDYKSSNHLPENGTLSSTYLTQSMQTDLQIEDLNSQLYMCRYVRDYISNPENENQLLPANSGIGGGSTEGLIANYNSLLLTRNEVLSQSSLTNPVVQEFDTKLSDLRRVILMSLENQMHIVNTQIKTYQDRHARSTRQLAETPNQAKYLQRVQRQQKVKEALYTYLLQKREETELNQAFIAYNSRLLSAPSGSFSPISPDTNKIKLYALVIGFLIPLAIILIMYMMNTKVRGRRDIEKLKVPFVGELPQVERTKKERRVTPHTVMEVKADSKNLINEAFRILRSNLAFVVGQGEDEQKQVIMVTSINAGSGKTFIMANLAASFAISGKRVLVVDLDLRKRSISKHVGRPKEGVSSYLSGQISDWHQAIVPLKEYDNMFMLPAGRTAPNPAELLQDARLKKLLEEAKKEFDYIFLDCPPAEIVADATIIKPLAEITLFIVRVGVMERSHLPVIDQYYKEGTFNNLCVILNGSEATSSRYGYNRYGYGYSYGYGYGYGYGYSYGYYGEGDDMNS